MRIITPKTLIAYAKRFTRKGLLPTAGIFKRAAHTIAKAVKRVTELQTLVEAQLRTINRLRQERDAYRAEVERRADDCEKAHGKLQRIFAIAKSELL